MNLNNFKQLVLFAMLDVDVPDWVVYITVDENGDIGIFTHRPSFNEEVWNGDLSKSPNSKARFLTTNNMRRITVNIPRSISWRQCIWKL